MTDPRIAIVRMVISYIASIVLWITCPDMAWLPLALCMPPGLFNNCPSSCSTTPVTQYQIVTSGFSNDSGLGACTDCNSYNGTWTVTSYTCTDVVDTNTACYCARVTINPCLCYSEDASSGHDKQFGMNSLALAMFEAGPEMNVTFGGNGGTGSPPADCHTLYDSHTGRLGVRWAKSESGKDCAALSSYSLPRTIKAIACLHDSSDATVTAL